MKTLPLLLLALAASLPLASASGPIVAAEYFINVDPGVDNGTEIPLVPESSFPLAVTVPPAVIAALPDGVNFLTCRVQDLDGSWSIAFTRSFHKEDPEAAEPVLAAEYFLNTDPGPGEATAIQVTPGTSWQTVMNVPPAAIAVLPDGVNHVTCRVKDADGDWSIAFTRAFHKEDPEPAAPLLEAEYFVDTDPGPGNATLLNIGSLHSASLAPVVQAEVIAALEDGVHTLTCRVKDADGEWAIAFSRSFYKEDPVEALPLAHLDYQWFSNGSPAGLVTSVPSSTGTPSASWMPQSPLPGATEGSVWQLAVTPWDSSGMPGVTTVRSVTVGPPPSFATWVQAAPVGYRTLDSQLPGDRYNNLLKYFLGLDPAVKSPESAVELVMSLEQASSGLIGLKFRRSRYTQGISGLVEASTTLQQDSWMTVSETEHVTPLDAYTDEVTLYAPAPDPEASKQFLRLNVTTP